jgi:hypothetical protein
MEEKAGLMAENDAAPAEGSADGTEKGGDKPARPAPRVSTELPQDVRTKLRKLEMLESKYKGKLLAS